MKKITALYSGTSLCMMIMLGAANSVSAQSAILKEYGTIPAGSSLSDIYQTGSFIGLGTLTPAGPLEVVDQSVSPASATNLANIVITQRYEGAANMPNHCVGSFNNPADVNCAPDYALVVRTPQSGSYTQDFTVTRSGQVGIGMLPHSGSGLSSKGWLDVQQLNTSSSGVVGLRFRNSSGTVNHNIATDANNQLTISPGVDNVSPAIVKVQGGLETSGNTEVDGALTVGGVATLNNTLTVSGSAQNVLTVNGNFTSSTAHIGNITSWPSGWYDLIVGGSILATRVKVAAQGSLDWADYVFADDYKLMPLSELADYVQENRHLPDVPSAEEVAKEGIDLQKMDATLLKKVEELTLYVLQQQEEIDALKGQLKKKK